MQYTIIKNKKYLPYTINLPVKTLECSRDVQNWLTNWQGCKTRQSVKGWFIEALIPINNLNKVMEAMPDFGWD